MRNLQFDVWKENNIYSVILYDASTRLASDGCKMQW